MTEYTKGPLLPKKQKIFNTVILSWSTRVAIEGPNARTNTGYCGSSPLPEEAGGNPAIVVRTGYAEVRSIFILKKNITEGEWEDAALEAVGRPESAIRGISQEYGVKATTISKIYSGLKYVSEYPFPPLKPKYTREELYDQIKVTCRHLGSCQEMSGALVSGARGAPCKPGDVIPYSMCAGMSCNCRSAREVFDLIAELEQVVPTRQQLFMMGDIEGQDGKIIDVEELKRSKRSEAAKKGWETRRNKAAERVYK